MSLIMLIEDHVQNARMVEKLLSRAGHKVLIANDGETGLSTIFEHHPDIVLMDLGLPDIDGQTVIGLIRQEATFAKMPIIVFTAWPEETAYEMADKYGCDGVIVKPIDPTRFAGQVAGFIKKEETE
jgi:CheY-like chemotaxis protein